MGIRFVEARQGKFCFILHIENIYRASKDHTSLASPLTVKTFRVLEDVRGVPHIIPFSGTFGFTHQQVDSQGKHYCFNS